MDTAPILVVDDEPDMRAALSHALNRSGFSVEIAASGPEAVLKLKNNTFSLVITDIKMPEMTGMQLLGTIKNISPRIPVIMITAFGTINNAVEAMQVGATDYILKPFSFEVLEAAVKKAIVAANGNGKKVGCQPKSYDEANYYRRSESIGAIKAGSECGNQHSDSSDPGRKRNRKGIIREFYSSAQPSAGRPVCGGELRGLTRNVGGK
jgi:DNA-binding NtrC family response regulator